MIEIVFWFLIVVIFFLLFFFGFFFGLEMVLMVVFCVCVYQFEKIGDWWVCVVGWLIVLCEWLIGVFFLGNNFVNILVLVLVIIVFLMFFGEVGVVIVMLVMIVFVLVFVEVLLKIWVIFNLEWFVLMVFFIVCFVVVVFGLIVIGVQWIVWVLLKLFGVNIGDDILVFFVYEELCGVVDFQYMEGGLEKGEWDCLGGFLDLVELEVFDVMVYCINMVVFNVDEDLVKLVEVVLVFFYICLLLWCGESDNFVGVLYVKDLLWVLNWVKGDVVKIDIFEIVVLVWFVLDMISLQDQLNVFLRCKVYFVLVVDEYGEVMGLVMFEDIFEEIVGEIVDEYDLELEGLCFQVDGLVIVDGLVFICDLNWVVDWDLLDDEVIMIVGFVIYEVWMILEEWQIFIFYGFCFMVLCWEKNCVI